jgi:hypothetical protein
MRWWLVLAVLAGCAAEFPEPAQMAPGDGGTADAQLDAAVAPEDALIDLGPDATGAPDALPDGMVDATVDAADATSLCADDELCNGLDDDCDGQIDEGFGQLEQPCNVGVGGCRAEGVWVCSADGSETICGVSPGEPQAERCDGTDNDCDGTDDNLANEGDACPIGAGACVRDGEIGCFNNEVTCVGEGGVPINELCNGIDDDCDSAVDEPGVDCTSGVGLCAAMGVLTCDGVEDGAPQRCSGVAGEPAVEICSGLDEDCDGAVDNAEGVGEPCWNGVGGCAAEGRQQCQGAALVCVGPDAGLPQPEVCNGLDDDCDGAVDNDLNLGGACVIGRGRCQTNGRFICDALGGVICEAEGDPLEPVPELCNGIDDDCDGIADQGFDVGQPCSVGVGQCQQGGLWACSDDVRVCGAQAGDPGDEICNGFDDDCDGSVDEAFGDAVGSVCGPWIAEHCRVWLGWKGNVGAGMPVSNDWGACPVDPRSVEDRVSCVSSNADSEFHGIVIGERMDDNDWLGLRFECDGVPVGDWIEQNCGVALAYIDSDVNGAFAGMQAAACGDRSDGGADNEARCISTSGDTRFHPLQTRGDVNDHDQFSLAFYCAADEPERARAELVQSGVEIFLGLEERSERDGCKDSRPEIVQAPTWGNCPNSLLDGGGHNRCVGNPGGVNFRGSVKPEHQVEECDQFGVLLKATRP